MSRRSVIGFHACREVRKVQPRSIREILLKSGYESSEELRTWAAFAKKQGIPVKIVGLSGLDRIGSGHQGLCLVVDGQPTLDLEKLGETKERTMLVALDQIEDTHNLGAILRTCWLMGVAAVIIPERRSVHLTPSVSKVASGGAEHVPLVTVSQLPDTLERLKEHGFWVFGLEASGAKDIWSFEMPEKVIWVIGSEESGLRSTTKRKCDETVRLFQTTDGASLNASVAAALAIAETVRQWNRI